MNKEVIKYLSALILLGIMCLAPHTMIFYDERICFFILAAAILVFLAMMMRVYKIK